MCRQQHTSQHEEARTRGSLHIENPVLRAGRLALSHSAPSRRALASTFCPSAKCACRRPFPLHRRWRSTLAISRRIAGGRCDGTFAQARLTLVHIRARRRDPNSMLCASANFMHHPNVLSGECSARASVNKSTPAAHVVRGEGRHGVSRRVTMLLGSSAPGPSHCNSSLPRRVRDLQLAAIRVCRVMWAWPDVTRGFQQGADARWWGQKDVPPSFGHPVAPWTPLLQNGTKHRAPSLHSSVITRTTLSRIGTIGRAAEVCKTSTETHVRLWRIHFRTHDLPFSAVMFRNAALCAWCRRTECGRGVSNKREKRKALALLCTIPSTRSFAIFVRALGKKWFWRMTGRWAQAAVGLSRRSGVGARIVQ